MLEECVIYLYILYYCIV